MDGTIINASQSSSKLIVEKKAHSPSKEILESNINDMSSVSTNYSNSNDFRNVVIPQNTILSPQPSDVKTPVHILIYFIAAAMCMMYSAFHGMSDTMFTLSDKTLAAIGLESDSRSIKNGFEFSVSTTKLVGFGIALFVPFIVEHFGEYTSMAISLIGYVAINAAPIVSYHYGFALWPFYIGGALKGIAAPIFWTSYSIFRTEIADDSNQGLTKAVFHSIYHLNNIISNVIWIAMVYFEVSVLKMFTVCAAIQALGVFGIMIVIYLGKYKYKVSSGKAEKETKHIYEIWKKLCEVMMFDDIKQKLFLNGFLMGIVEGWLYGDIIKYFGTSQGWTYAPGLKLVSGIAILIVGLHVGVEFDRAQNKLTQMIYGHTLLISGIFLLIISTFVGDFVWSGQGVGYESAMLALAYIAIILIASGIPCVEVTKGALYSALWKQEATYVFSWASLTQHAGVFLSLPLGSMNELYDKDYPFLFNVGPESSLLSLVNAGVALFASFIALYIIYFMDPNDVNFTKKTIEMEKSKDPDFISTI